MYAQNHFSTVIIYHSFKNQQNNNMHTICCTKTIEKIYLCKAHLVFYLTLVSHRPNLSLSNLLLIIYLLLLLYLSYYTSTFFIFIILKAHYIYF